METPNTQSRDDDYANGPYVAGSELYPERWTELATNFRSTTQSTLDIPYGTSERHRFDLFVPADTPKGLVVFIHGGYWLNFDKSSWSHLAEGGVKSGYAVAIPSYTLCPYGSIPDIVQEIAKAIEHAASIVDGPVHICGHSAGGHLVSRMVSQSTPLSKSILNRLGNVISISGVHDLRPLLHTEMNGILKLDMATAISESPALLLPANDVHVNFTCWVGADERPEFVRQNALLANIWSGYSFPINAVVEPSKHHFNIVDGLMDVEHDLLKTLLKD